MEFTSSQFLLFGTNIVYHLNFTIHLNLFSSMAEICRDATSILRRYEQDVLHNIINSRDNLIKMRDVLSIDPGKNSFAIYLVNKCKDINVSKWTIYYIFSIIRDSKKLSNFQNSLPFDTRLEYLRKDKG